MDSGADQEFFAEQTVHLFTVKTPSEYIYNVQEGGPGLQGPWGKRKESKHASLLSELHSTLLCSLSSFHTLVREVFRFTVTGPGPPF